MVDVSDEVECVFLFAQTVPTTTTTTTSTMAVQNHHRLTTGFLPPGGGTRGVVSSDFGDRRWRARTRGGRALFPGACAVEISRPLGWGRGRSRRRLGRVPHAVTGEPPSRSLRRIAHLEALLAQIWRPRSS